MQNQVKSFVPHRHSQSARWWHTHVHVILIKLTCFRQIANSPVIWQFSCVISISEIDMNFIKSSVRPPEGERQRWMIKLLSSRIIYFWFADLLSPQKKRSSPHVPNQKELVQKWMCRIDCNWALIPRRHFIWFGNLPTWGYHHQLSISATATKYISMIVDWWMRRGELSRGRCKFLSVRSFTTSLPTGTNKK